MARSTARWWQSNEYMEAVQNVAASGRPVPWLHVYDFACQMADLLEYGDLRAAMELVSETPANPLGTSPAVAPILTGIHAVHLPNWRKIRDWADSQAGPEREAAEAGRQKAIEAAEAEKARLALEAAEQAAAEREIAEAHDAVMRERDRRFLADVPSAAALRTSVERTVEERWVKARAAFPVSKDELADVTAELARSQFQCELYPALLRRAEKLDRLAQVFKGCHAAVAELHTQFTKAGGQGAVFWLAMAYATEAEIPDDYDYETGQEATAEVPESHGERPEPPKRGRGRDYETEAIRTFLAAQDRGITFESWSSLATVVGETLGIAKASAKRHALYPMYAGEVDQRKASGQPWFELIDGQVVLHNVPIWARLDDE